MSESMEPSFETAQPAVTLEMLDHLERLSHLRLSAEDRPAMVADMVKILGYARALSNLDLTAFAPLTHAMEQGNVLREDRIEPSSTLEQALANAPQTAGPYIQVPQVLE